MAEPAFEYIIPGHTKPIDKDSRLWALPLKGEGRNPVNLKNDTLKNDEEILIGEYFSAAKEFIRQNEFLSLSKIIERQDLKYIEKIQLSLEKHGQFYHAVKITVFQRGKTPLYLVLNGAISKEGLSIIGEEYKLLEFLNSQFVQSYIPEVYYKSDLRIRDRKVSFFLGEWFEGYKEFHLTRIDDEIKTSVWEGDGSVYILSDNRSSILYSEIARILTFFYNVETFEQVFPWHHAAGDFIVKPEDDDFKVKLITVRGYTSMLESETKTPPTQKIDVDLMLSALLHFFLNLSLRIRLDRIDGIKEMVLVPEAIIPHFFKGFIKGLEDKSDLPVGGKLKYDFFCFVKKFSYEQLLEIFLSIIGAEHTDSSEIQVILNDLQSHCKIIFNHLKKMEV